VQALRIKLNTRLGTGLTRSWVEVAACNPLQGPNTAPKPPKKELNCVYISTRRAPDEDKDGNDHFRRYLLTDMANAKIRSALLSMDPTKEV
jgi:hypothetical protein